MQRTSELNKSGKLNQRTSLLPLPSPNRLSIFSSSSERGAEERKSKNSIVEDSPPGKDSLKEEAGGGGVYELELLLVETRIPGAVLGR